MRRQGGLSLRAMVVPCAASASEVETEITLRCVIGLRAG